MKRITKEIINKDYKNIYPLISRDYMAKQINKDLDLLFEYKQVIVFAKIFKKEKLEKLLNETPFIIGNFFKGNYKNFNEQSYSVAIIKDISFESFKNIVNKISEKFKQNLLIRFEYNVYLLEKWGGERVIIKKRR